MSDIDYSKDKFQEQGHWHDLPPGSSGAATGVPRTESESYSVSKNPDQALSESIALKRCLSCSTEELKPEYKYCPNCGLLFI